MSNASAQSYEQLLGRIAKQKIRCCLLLPMFRGLCDSWTLHFTLLFTQQFKIQMQGEMTSQNLWSR